MNNKKNILVTGGAGFIGSHLVRLMVSKYPDYHIFNLDALTYAGNLENLKDLEEKKNYTFLHGDICDKQFLTKVFTDYKIDGVIHLAAESHVDRSIANPDQFAITNIIGTLNLLNTCRMQWSDYTDKLFFNVSTDEVYGSLDDDGLFTETTSYDPRSPYSASKASADHFVRAYHHTYGLPIVISNCSNNYGPYQFPEKLIPLMINNIKSNKELPVYGEGTNVRDWLWVEDHALAIDKIFHHGKSGETYNIGGNNEWTNIDLVKKLCSIMDNKLNRSQGESENLIRFVTDRAGHDKRYAIDASKIKNELGWEPSVEFDEGFEKTVDWYLQNEKWMKKILSGEYQQYYDKQYKNR